MKKIVCLFVLFVFVLTGCSAKVAEKSADLEFSKGVWLSYTEIDTLLKSPQGFKQGFDAVLENLKGLCITDLYFHVTSHCDSVIDSEYLPQKESTKALDYDILEYATAACHKENIKLHAWLNPYRVSAVAKKTEALPKGSPARKWLQEEDGLNAIEYNGIYLNPASENARRLVTNAIGELMENYDIDGIHFDDYFYPTTDPEFDSKSYNSYKKSTKIPLSLENWRRANVDMLICDCKTLIKSLNPQVIFSVSPAASADKNYNTLYADVKGWCEQGYIDVVIPQLYFGFEHTLQEFCFESLLNEWKNICQNTEVALLIGTAPYKIGTASNTDGTEWQESGDILARQVRLCRADPLIGGVVFFSYTGLFSQDGLNTIERENLKAVL